MSLPVAPSPSISMPPSFIKCNWPGQRAWRSLWRWCPVCLALLLGPFFLHRDQYTNTNNKQDTSCINEHQSNVTSKMSLKTLDATLLLSLRSEFLMCFNLGIDACHLHLNSSNFRFTIWTVGRKLHNEKPTFSRCPAFSSGMAALLQSNCLFFCAAFKQRSKPWLKRATMTFKLGDALMTSVPNNFAELQPSGKPVAKQGSLHHHLLLAEKIVTAAQWPRVADASWDRYELGQTISVSPHTDVDAVRVIFGKACAPWFTFYSNQTCAFSCQRCRLQHTDTQLIRMLSCRFRR